VVKDKLKKARMEAAVAYFDIISGVFPEPLSETAKASVIIDDLRIEIWIGPFPRT
jgi:hypothetical protein